MAECSVYSRNCQKASVAAAKRARAEFLGKAVQQGRNTLSLRTLRACAGSLPCTQSKMRSCWKILSYVVSFTVVD